MTTATTTTSVYVGTYAKYNNGSIEGKWMDLEEYSDKETFIAACQELHKDEADPELMFQDWEGVPDGMISECSLSDEIFAFIQLDDKDKQILATYRDNIDQTASIEDATEAYRGTYESAADYAEEFYRESGSLKGVPNEVAYYIDWEKVARDMGHSGTTFVEVAYRECMVFAD